MIRAFLRDERGATAIEYAVIASLIFLAIVAAIVPIGQTLNGVFGQVSNGFSG
ncbi:MAG: Flp family type IVb pilin [Proteobacteria bacterium]|nr:Flp family type IVb pilin [Pseudomonadota bacterium]